MSTVHVYPEGDLVEHDTDGGDCVCVPATEPVTRDDGSIGWVITHHSLDGREAHEQEENPMSEPTEQHGPKHAAPDPVPGTRAEADADARTRFWRTSIQGALAAVLVAVATVVLDLVTPGTVIDWPVLAATAGTAAVTAVAAYVQRRLEGGQS